MIEESSGLQLNETPRMQTVFADRGNEHDAADRGSEARASGTAGAVMGWKGKEWWRTCGTVTRAASGAFRDAHL
jgi:hypothetical protein